jgi:hypothetical protein
MRTVASSDATTMETGRRQGSSVAVRTAPGSRRGTYATLAIEQAPDYARAMPAALQGGGVGSATMLRS